MGVCIDIDTWVNRNGDEFLGVNGEEESVWFQGLGKRGVFMWAFIWALPN